MRSRRLIGLALTGLGLVLAAGCSVAGDWSNSVDYRTPREMAESQPSRAG
jgi:hypothetical protein